MRTLFSDLYHSYEPLISLVVYEGSINLPSYLSLISEKKAHIPESTTADFWPTKNVCHVTLSKLPLWSSTLLPGTLSY